MDLLNAGWTIPVGLLAIGAVLAYFSLALLGEYRKVFFVNPRSVMSFEVWAQLLFHPSATLAYLGVFVLFIALWFLAIGLFILLTMLGMTVVELSHRLIPLAFPRTQP